MFYQLGWTTLPGLRGISCSEFRATPLTEPADPAARGGVAIEFPSEAERDAFLRELEEHFVARRFTNAADAFDTVKAYVAELRAKRDSSCRERTKKQRSTLRSE